MKDRRRAQGSNSRWAPTGCRRLMLCALSMAAAAPAARAVTCSVSAVAVSFGSYNPFASQPLDGTGSVSVQCDASTSYTIALGPGSGTFASRQMQSGANVLDYNLYTDAAYSSIWGDGSSGTATVAGSGTSGTYTVFGEIPALQNASVGSYSDSITVTVTY